MPLSWSWDFPDEESAKARVTELRAEYRPEHYRIMTVQNQSTGGFTVILTKLCEAFESEESR